MKEINLHNEGFQKAVGGVGALLQVGLLVSEYAESGDLRYSPIFVALALLFLASARFVVLGSIQAALFFALTGQQTADSLNSFFGLGFACIAAFIVFRRGWFVRNAWPKACLIAGMGSALLVVPILLIDTNLLSLAPASISAAIYMILVIGFAKGRFLSALIPKKSVLRIADYKLTRRETMFVKARLSGRSVKELACDNALAASTVGNALCSAYHKLGLEGAEELLALGERYRIEWPLVPAAARIERQAR